MKNLFAVQPKWLNEIPMRLELSKDEMEELLLLLELGLWVREKEGELRKDKTELAKVASDRVWGQIEQSKLAPLARKWRDKIVPSETFSKKVDEVMNRFLEDEFWDELESRLAERDFFKYATEAEAKLARETGELPEKAEWYYRKWRKEFDQYDISRLDVEGE